jgi:hypothetical protein
MGTGKVIGPNGQVVYHFEVQVKEGVYRIHKQVGILKVGEHKEVNHNAHHHPKLLPPPLFGYMNQVSQVVIRKGGEDQYEEKESGCFPVKKETGEKKKSVPYRPFLIESGVNQEHHSIEPPEKEAGKNKWLLRIKEEYIGKYLTQLMLYWVVNWLYSSINAL